MTTLETNAAGTRSTRAAKSLATMRTAITRADEARSDAAHQARGRAGRPDPAAMGAESVSWRAMTRMAARPPTPRQGSPCGSRPRAR